MAAVRKTKAPIGASLVVVSSIFYASYGIWTTLMGDFFDGYTASAIRSVLVLLILLPFAVAYRQLQPLDLRRNGYYIGGMVIASFFTWGPLYYAILHAGVGISLAVSYASIVLGSFFFGWLFAQERFTRDKAISAVLGIVGLGLIFSPTTGSHEWLALGGALVSGLSAGINIVFSKRISYNATQSTLTLWGTSMIANVIMAFMVGRLPMIGLRVEWLYLVFFTLASVIASWLFIRVVKSIDAGAAGILGLLEIVFGVLFGIVFFQERPGPVVLLGMSVIIAAASIPYVRSYMANQRKADTVELPELSSAKAPLND